MEKIKFILNGCDISFIAEAPKDITLEQLLKQCTRITPDYCACGICALGKEWYEETEADIIIDYDNVKKANDNISCKIENIEDIKGEYTIYE